MTKVPNPMSIRDRLKNVANKTKKSFELVQTEFLLERAVFRLCSDANLSQHLIFKGGYVGLRCYESGRSTVDIDALIYQIDKKSALDLAQKAVSSDLLDGVWFTFEKEVDLVTQGEYGGTRLRFRGGIGQKTDNIKASQVVDIDFGVGDVVFPGPIENNIKAMILGDEISWKVYPVETLCSEKIHALIDKGEVNSRSKDIYDLYQYLDKCDPVTLQTALRKTFERRETPFPESFGEAYEKIDKSVLRRGWKSLVKQLQAKTRFDEAEGFISGWFSANNF